MVPIPKVQKILILSPITGNMDHLELSIIVVSSSYLVLDFLFFFFTFFSQTFSLDNKRKGPKVNYFGVCLEANLNIPVRKSAKNLNMIHICSPAHS